MDIAPVTGSVTFLPNDKEAILQLQILPDAVSIVFRLLLPPMAYQKDGIPLLPFLSDVVNSDYFSIFFFFCCLPLQGDTFHPTTVDLTSDPQVPSACSREREKVCVCVHACVRVCVCMHVCVCACM